MFWNSNTSLPNRSIADIISPYRNSFRDIDFRDVLSALISREEFLTRDFNIQTMHWEREQRRLRRELSAIKEREEKGIRVLELEKDGLSSKLQILKSSLIESNDCIKDLIRVLDEKDVEICRLVEKLSQIGGENEKIRVLISEFEGFVWKVDVLAKEKREVEVKLDEFRRENDCLVADKVKFDEELRKLEMLYVGIKDEIGGLMRVLGEKNKEICGKNERIEMLTRRVEVLEKKKREKEVKFDEIQRENDNLIAKVAKSDEESKSLRKEMDGKIMEMKKKNDVEMASLGREKEVKIQELNKKIEGLQMEKSEIEIKLEEFRRENERVVEQLDKLEKEKIQNEMKLEKFRRDNEYLKAMKEKSDEEMESLRKFSKEMDVMIKEMKLKKDAQIESLGREKEVKIEQLKNKIEWLEVEKSEAIEEKEEEMRKYEKLELQVVKLEGDVARLLVGNVPNCKKLTNDEIEKVLSCVINVLDSEEDSGIDRVEKSHRGAPVASYKAAVNTTSGFVTEVRRETKRRRLLSQCSNQKIQSDDTSNKSLNPSCKVKKAVDLSQVDLVHKPRIAGDEKRATLPKQVIAPVRLYEETSVNVKEPLSNSMMGGDSSQLNDCSPQVKELIANCRRNKRL